MTIETKTIDLIRQELENIAPEHQRPLASTYEGYAILNAQVNDLWYQITKGEKRIKKQLRYETNLQKDTEHYQKLAVREEATKVAAMAVRIIQELTKLPEDIKQEQTV